LRKNFQEIYKEPTKEGFEEALKKWYFWATHSRIGPMKEATKTIKAHWCGFRYTRTLDPVHSNTLFRIAKLDV
jgi:hypothetical protein